MVEYTYQKGETQVTDLAVYDPFVDCWIFPGKLSEKATTKIVKKNDFSGYLRMQELEWMYVDLREI